jgi:uncharacterized protein (DUF1015 family)
MAIIKPFKAIRPRQDLVDKVAALPYDVMSSDEARNMVFNNPYSFLHIDKAEIDLDPDIYIYDKKVYEKAKNNLNDMIKKSILVQEDQPCFYIYKLTMDGRSQTGIVVCTSIDEYIDGTIKKHELTREDKEIDRINHVDYCNANTGPIFLTYRLKESIDKIIKEYMCNHKMEYSFESDDHILQEVWVISDKSTINDLINEFKTVPSLYIADGHHRNASAVKVGLKRRQDHPNYNGDEEFNYYLSVIFPDNELSIMDYNRVIKDLNGLTEKEFIEKLSEKFVVEAYINSNGYKPEEIHTFGMYINKMWYKVKLKEEFLDGSDSVASLDVSILQKQVLEPLLGIKDPRTDKRIDFIGGIRGIKELVKRVDSGEMKLAFSMYPTSINELMTIADSGKIMPPKSTWFEPKLRSGLFIHSLSDR